MEITYEEFLDIVKNSSEKTESGGECPVTRTLNLVQGKWVLHILFFLCKNEPSRFGEIHRAHPNISKTMLSTVLKQLEKDGLVSRRQFNEIPPHTEYSLTENGNAMMSIFYEMFKWGVRHLDNTGPEEK